MPRRQCSVPGGTGRESAPRETCSTTNTYQCFRIITRAAVIVTFSLQQGKAHERTLTTKNTRNRNKHNERTLQPDRIASHQSKMTRQRRRCANETATETAGDSQFFYH